MNEPSEKWLASLKEGDEVVIRNWHNFGDHYAVAAIERVTTTQIKTPGRKWCRKTGRSLPRSSYRCVAIIDMPPEEAREIVRRRELFRSIEDRLRHEHYYNFPDIKTGELEAFVAALEPPTPSPR